MNPTLEENHEAAFLEALRRTSYSKVAPLTSNSEPRGSVTRPREFSGRPAVSPDEPYLELQRTQDEIF